MVLGETGTLSILANISLSVVPDGFAAKAIPMKNMEKTYSIDLLNIGYITTSFTFLLFQNSTTNLLKIFTNKGLFG